MNAVKLASNFQMAPQPRMFQFWTTDTTDESFSSTENWTFNRCSTIFRTLLQNYRVLNEQNHTHAPELEKNPHPRTSLTQTGAHLHPNLSCKPYKETTARNFTKFITVFKLSSRTKPIQPIWAIDLIVLFDFTIYLAGSRQSLVKTTCRR